MRTVIAPRGQGKTQAAIDWLSGGYAIDSFPWWSRILLVPDQGQKNWIVQHYGLKKDQTMIYSFEEWKNTKARGTKLGLEVAIDNVDMLLNGMLHGQRVKLVTINEDEEK